MTKITFFNRWRLLGLMLSLGLGLLLLALLIATSGGQVEAAPAATTYAVTWYTADNGGGSSSGGSYAVAGTIGQMDAAATASGSSYSTAGGFWQGFLDTLYEIFLPTILK